MLYFVFTDLTRGFLMNNQDHNENNNQSNYSNQQINLFDNYKVFLKNIILSFNNQALKEKSSIIQRIYDFFNAPLTNDYKISVFSSDEYFNSNSSIIQLNVKLFEHIIDSINNYVFSKGFEINYTLSSLFRVERDENKNIKNLIEDKIKDTNEVIFHIELNRLDDEELNVIGDEIRSIIDDCIGHK